MFLTPRLLLPMISYALPARSSRHLAVRALDAFALYNIIIYSLAFPVSAPSSYLHLYSSIRASSSNWHPVSLAPSPSISKLGFVYGLDCPTEVIDYCFCLDYIHIPPSHGTCHPTTRAEHSLHRPDDHLYHTTTLLDDCRGPVLLLCPLHCFPIHLLA